MALKIVWTLEAQKGLQAVILYLEKEWTAKEIIRLENNIHNLVNNISRFPHMYPASLKHPSVRKALVDKNNYIIYRINLSNKIIEILNFRSVKQKPLP